MCYTDLGLKELHKALCVKNPSLFRNGLTQFSSYFAVNLNLQLNYEEESE